MGLFDDLTKTITKSGAAVIDKAKGALDDAGKAADDVMNKVEDFLKNAFGPKDDNPEGQA